MKILLCLLLVLSASVMKGQEESVTLSTSSGDLFGVLTLPAVKENIPVVLIIAGSGPTDKDGNNPEMRNNSLKMLAEELQKNGLASLRFDKRGIAESRAAADNEFNLLFEDYVEDVKGWIDLLYEDERFSQVIVAGHSEGSLVGLLASIDNPSVSGYISLEGAGYPAGKLLRRQLSTQPEAIKKVLFQMISQLEKGDSITHISPLYYTLFRPSVQPYLISWFRYDPAKEIAKLNIPILIVQGTTDIQITEDNANLLAGANPKAQKTVIEDMNHVLKKCQGTDMDAQIIPYTNPTLPLHPDLIKSIIQFIKDAK